MYKSTQELPATLQSTLPIEAQELYVDTYNLALKRDEIQPQGELTEDSMAHQVAWQAVEQEFVKDSSSGKWHRKGEPIPENENQGILDKIKSIF